jgi:disulfide bond formation protein DsbB
VFLFRLVQSFTASRLSWGLLIIFSLIMEGCALYFQYGIKLDPCVNCVYERACIALFFVAGFIGFLLPQFKLVRILASLIFLVSSAVGLKISIAHYISSISTGFGASCALKADFPLIPLDEILPWLFKPVGQCGPLNWSLLGLSMPAWLIIIFACGLAVSLVFLFCQFVSMRESFDRYYR